MHPFWIYDRGHVSVETYSGETLLRDERDVLLYEEIFARFAGAAVYGQAFTALLDALAEEYRHSAGIGTTHQPR